MKLLIFILFFSPIAIWTQVTPMNYDLREIELLKFVEKHLDSISTYHPNEKGFVLELKVNQKNKLLTSLIFYKLDDTLMSHPIKTWTELDTYIRKLYFFHPSVEYYEQENSASLMSLRMVIPLNKKYLKREIKSLERNYPNCNEQLIKPNASFSLEIKLLKIKPLNSTDTYTLENLKIESTLEGLKSGIIQLDENFFCYLRVLNTSNANDCYSQTELFVYLIEDRTTILVSQASFKNHALGTNTVSQSSEFHIESKPSEKGFEQLHCILNFK